MVEELEKSLNGYVDELDSQLDDFAGAIEELVQVAKDKAEFIDSLNPGDTVYFYSPEVPIPLEAKYIGEGYLPFHLLKPVEYILVKDDILGEGVLGTRPGNLFADWKPCMEKAVERLESVLRNNTNMIDKCRLAELRVIQNAANEESCISPKEFSQRHRELKSAITDEELFEFKEDILDEVLGFEEDDVSEEDHDEASIEESNKD